MALPLRLPVVCVSTIDEDGEEEEEEEVDEVDAEDRGVCGLLVVLRDKAANGWCCWCWRRRGWVKWVGGEPNAEPQAR